MIFSEMDEKKFDDRFQKLQQSCHLAIIKVIIIITYCFALSRRDFVDKIKRVVDSKVVKIRLNLLKQLLTDKKSRNIIRMIPNIY